MNFHLNRNGQNLGTFPLEELRRRRRIGELTGTELVWCPGMPEWKPLDTVIAPEVAKTTASAPPPIPRSVRANQSNPVFMWAMVGAGIIVFIGLIIFGFSVQRNIQQFQKIQQSKLQQPGEDLKLVKKRVTWRTNSVTEAEATQRKRAFRMRVWVDEYQKHGQHDQPYDADATRYIQIWIDNNYGGKLATNATALRKLGDKLAADRTCNDPLVLTVAGVNSIELHESIQRLERALKGFEKSSYSAYPQMYAAVELADKLSENPERGATLDATAVRLFKEALKDGSLRPEDQADIGEIMINGWGERFFKRNGEKILPGVREAGKSFAWLALLLEGQYHMETAWQARGSGYANTVSEQGWKTFNAQMEKASDCLCQAWQMNPEQPLAPNLMISVALASSDLEDMRLWFDRTIDAQIDYPGAWSNLRWGLRPRWHGSLEAMLALGVNALDTKRFDTDVPRKLMDVITDLEAEQELPPGRHIYGRADIWPLVQRMYEGYLAEPTQSNYLSGWRTSYAVAAYLGGKYDVARTQMEALKWKPVRSNLTGWGTDLSLMTYEIAAMTSPAGKPLAEAERNYKRGDIDTALRQFNSQSTSTNLDDRTVKFIHFRTAALEQEQHLERGEWVDFLPKENNDPAWVRLIGRYEHESDGALKVSSSTGGHFIFSRVRMSSEFEVKGEFEVVQTSNKSFQAGLIMGEPDPRSYDWYGFRMKRNDVEGDVTSFALGWSTLQALEHVTLNDKQNSFTFRFQGGKGSATLNGKEIFRDAVPPRAVDFSHQEVHLGVGAFNDMNDTVIRYRNVQVRRLSSTTRAALK